MDTSSRNILNIINIPTNTLLDTVCNDLWTDIVRYYNKPPSIYAIGSVDGIYPNYEPVEADDNFLDSFRHEFHNNTIYSLCDICACNVISVGKYKTLSQNYYRWIVFVKGNPVIFNKPHIFGIYESQYYNLISKLCLFKFIGT